MGAGLFTAYQYETIQQKCGEDLAAFLGKLGIDVPDFTVGSMDALRDQLNDAIVSKLCQKLHAKSLRKGCEQVLALAGLPAPSSDTHEELFARVAEHREEILAACRKKAPQERRMPPAANSSAKEFHVEPQSRQQTIKQHLARAGGAFVLGTAAFKMLLSSTGAGVGVGVLLGILTYALSQWKEKKEKAQAIMSRTVRTTAAASLASPKFSWDQTHADELAEALDLVSDLSHLAQASHRS